MQVSRPLGDDFRRFSESRAAIAPIGIGATYKSHLPAKALIKTPITETRLDVLQYCGGCGVSIRQDTAKTLSKLRCQGCRRSELQRQRSLEDIRPASPMADKSKALISAKSDCRVRPTWTEVDLEPEWEVGGHSQMLRVNEDAGFFRSMEVLTCFRSEVRRGLRLLSKAATAEKWHMFWAILLTMCLMPMLLALLVVAGVGFLALSTWVAVVAVIVFPLAYINPRLYNFVMDS